MPEDFDWGHPSSALEGLMPVESGAGKEVRWEMYSATLSGQTVSRPLGITAGPEYLEGWGPRPETEPGDRGNNTKSVFISCQGPQAFLKGSENI